ECSSATTRSSSRVTETTRYQTGVKPRHEGVDAEHRETQALRQGTSIGHHVGAFEEHRADAVMACHEPVASGEDIALGRGDIEPVLIVDHDAAELAAAVGADDRRRRIGTRSAQMLLGEVCGADREDTHSLAG